MSVTDHMSEYLGKDCVELLAVDGAHSDELNHQLWNIKPNISHVALSVGGNDALSHYSYLASKANSVEEVLRYFGNVQLEFRTNYHSVLNQLSLTSKEISVCTIYDAIPDGLSSQVQALSFFNDVIVREALRFGFNIIDLREILTLPSDFSNISPIEPSASGGRKVAKAISNWVKGYI